MSFFSVKTKGWRFEDTRLTQFHRIEKLLALLAIGFVWAHKIGEWKASIKPIVPIVLKKPRNQKRPQNSYFRFGLDHLRDLLTNSRAAKNVCQNDKVASIKTTEDKFLKNCPVQRITFLIRTALIFS